MKAHDRFACLLALSLLLSQAAPAGTAPSIEFPVELAVPADQTLALTLYAKGVQIYEYRPVLGEPAKSTWVFKAPEADLFDAQGRKVGRHFAGPTWQLTDGGKVVGKVKAKTEGAGVIGVPWLLLDATQASGPVLGKVVSIQRVDTVGGKAPESPGTTMGQEMRVDYTATYKFFVPKN